MARSFIVYQGEDETPEFDLTDPDSPVHVIWEEIEAGGRAFQGESTTNSIPVRDERAETGNSQDLPSGLTLTSLSRGSRWVWMDGPDGDEVIMASGRIGTKDYSRGRQKADRAREVTIQAADRNEELTEIIIDDWVRPEETDVARVNALITAYLSGTPRATTVLANTYVASGNTVTMPAKTYDGTNPKDVLSEIALQANKLFFVTVDDEVFYDTADSTVYQAGIRISDRIDEMDTETVCSAGESATVTGSGADYSSTASLPVTVAAGTGGLIFALGTHSGVTSITVEYQSDGSNPTTRVTMALIGTVTHASGVPGEESLATKLNVYWLAAPAEGVLGPSIVWTFSGTQQGFQHGYWTVDNSATPSVVTATGTGTTSSVTPSAGASDLVLDVLLWRRWSLGNASNDPTPTASQTEDWSVAANWSAGQHDAAWGGANKVGAGARTWSWTDSNPWVAAVITISSSEPSEVATFPPIWDVGPSSTEDGLELVSGLRLYYGQDGAYVYVNHTETAESYWHAERSFYTQDPAINDSTKATALANAMLTRLRFEERTYNVSIGPLGVEHVGCIKPGQLINIKARAIPDADDQYVSRRIAQLKWTTPVPGVFFARMQLDRPIKELPYGIGAKAGHDALENHKEGDAHPASAIVITDSGAYFAATDVEAALQELGAAGSATSIWYNVETYGAVHDGVTDDEPAIQDAIDAAATAGGGVVWFPSGTYIIGDTLELKANVQLRGSSMASSPILASSFSGTLFDVTASGGGIHDLFIDHSGFVVGSARTGAIISLGTTEVDLLHFSGLRTVSDGAAIVSAHATQQHSDVFVSDSQFFRAGSNGTILDLDSVRNVHLSSVACFTSGAVTEANVVISDGSDDIHWAGGHIHGDLTIGANRVQVTGTTIFDDVTLTADSNDCVILGNSIGGTVTDNGTNNITPGSGGASALDDLTDVTITAAAEDDTLRYVGSAWVNDNRRWEAVTDGADTFVWEGDDLVHEWSEY